MKRGEVIGISASKGAAILKKPDGSTFNPYQTEFDVFQGWIEKVAPGWNQVEGYLLKEKEYGAPLNWGKAFESSIISLASDSHESPIIEREKLFLCGFDRGFIPPDLANTPTGKLLGYVDGLFESGEIHEGKLTNFWNFRDRWGEPLTDQVPAEIQIQAQHSMIVTGLDKVIVSVLVLPKRPDEYEAIGWEIQQYEKEIFEDDHSGYYLTRESEEIPPLSWAKTLAEMGEFHQYFLHKNERLHSLMIDKYQEWWTRHIDGRKAPEPDSYDDIRRMVPDPIGTIVVPPDIERKFVQYADIGDELKSTGPLAKQRERIKVFLLNWARNQISTFDDKTKWIFKNEQGKKLGQFNGKQFRK